MTLPDQLHQLENSGLVRLAQMDPELEYAFRHALLQEAAYTSLLQDDRRRLHHSVGLVIERLYPERQEELAATLARHFSSAGDNRRALTYFVLAGEVAFRQYAIAEAIIYYRRALDILRQAVEPFELDLPQIYTRLGRALELDAQYAQALEVYAELEKLALGQNDRSVELTALVERAKIHCTPNRFFDADYGQGLCERALRLAVELGDRQAEARIHWILMMLYWQTWERNLSLSHGKQSLALARELGQQDQLASTLHDIHRPYMYTDQIDSAGAALAEAQQLWRELGNLPMLADNLASSADLVASKGEYDLALDFAEEAVRLSQSIGNHWNHAFGREMVGEICLYRGLMGQSLAAIQDAIDLSARAGLVILYRRACFAQIWAYLRIGALTLAERSLDRIERLIDEGSEFFPGFSRAEALRYRGYINLERGQMEAAQSFLQQSEAAMEDAGDISWLGLRLQGELALARGDAAQAFHSFDAFITRKPFVVGIYTNILEVLCYKGWALLLLGRLSEAEHVLLQALEEGRSTASRHSLWRTLFVLSLLADRRGEREKAADLRRQSVEVIRTIADHIGDARMRESFLQWAPVQVVLNQES